VHTHLGFINAKYAICGATQNSLNPVTTDANAATCPDCLDEHDFNERTNGALHRGPGLRPTYEVMSGD